MSHELLTDDATGAAADDDSLGPPSGGPPASSNRWQFVWTVGFAFAIVALQMGQGILLARLLGPEGRGEYATAVLYVQMLLYIGLFGGLEVICRYAAEDAVQRDRLRRASLWLGITTGLITSLVVISLNLIAMPAEKRFLIPLAMLCSLSIVGQHVMLIMTAVDRGSGEFGKYNLRRILAAAAFPALLLIAACVTEIEVVTACWLFVGSSLISMAACVVGLRKPLRGESHPKVPRLLKESQPYAFSMLATDLFERLDLLLVMWLAPLLDQGLYAAMVPVVYPLTVIPNTLGLFLFNAGANRDRRLQTADIHRILASSLAVQVASTIAFMLLIGPVVVFLYGSSFEPAIIFALWLAPVSAIKGVLQGLDSYLKGRGRPLAVIRARIFAMAVMVGVTWLLFDRFAAVAIAMAALAGQLVCLFWLSLIVYADVRQSE